MINRIWLPVLLLTWALLLMAGCKPSVSRGFQYPPTWPIKELTVPAGATQLTLEEPGSKSARLYRDGDPLAQGTSTEYRDWTVAFDFAGDAKQIQDHLDACLKPLGFKLLRASALPNHSRTYISSDGIKEVGIDYLTVEPLPMANIKGFKGYRLRVLVWSNPRPDVSIAQPIP